MPTNYLDRKPWSTIYVDSVATPIGLVFFAVSEIGICDLTLGETSESRYCSRLSDFAFNVCRIQARSEYVSSQLAEYFSDSHYQFTLSVDLRGATFFTKRVLKAVMQLPHGMLMTYGDIATRIGSPRAGRAVGAALGRNPVPIVIPCHRVIKRGGDLGGFSYGLSAKRFLLGFEGFQFNEKLRIGVTREELRLRATSTWS